MRTDLLVVVAVAFVAGYVLVSRLFKAKEQKGAGPNPQEEVPKAQQADASFKREKYDRGSWRSSNSSETGAENNEERSRQREANIDGHGNGSEEMRYGAILGLKGKVTPAEVKKAYREMLLKYHPDKVNHLGTEFQDIAAKKALDVIEAYDFFRKKYDIK